MKFLQHYEVEGGLPKVTVEKERTRETAQEMTVYDKEFVKTHESLLIDLVVVSSLSTVTIGRLYLINQQVGKAIGCPYLTDVCCKQFSIICRPLEIEELRKMIGMPEEDALTSQEVQQVCLENSWIPFSLKDFDRHL
jgi:hypothetical protein